MEMKNLEKKFKEVDVSDLPNFDVLKTPLHMGLWVLYVAKDKPNIKKLTAEDIASIIVNAKEVSIKPRALVNAFNRCRSRNMVHVSNENGKMYYEIMKPGKEYLRQLARKGDLQVFYVNSDRPYTTRQNLKEILKLVKNDVRIVDPYCSGETLQILKNLNAHKVRVLTQLDNLKPNDEAQFRGELKSFKLEYGNIDFANYPNCDIHDRYILSSDYLILLGHGIKDLGRKESFCVVLGKALVQDIFEPLVKSFDVKWNRSNML